MRFLGAAGGPDQAARVSLDREAIQVRGAAGVRSLSADWGAQQKGSGYRKMEAGGVAAGTGNRRTFRHLCTATSCRGV